jgi:hypothetical protein
MSFMTDGDHAFSLARQLSETLFEISDQISGATVLREGVVWDKVRGFFRAVIAMIVKIVSTVWSIFLKVVTYVKELLLGRKKVQVSLRNATHYDVDYGRELSALRSGMRSLHEGVDVRAVPDFPDGIGYHNTNIEVGQGALGQGRGGIIPRDGALGLSATEGTFPEADKMPVVSKEVTRMIDIYNTLNSRKEALDEFRKFGNELSEMCRKAEGDPSVSSEMQEGIAYLAKRYNFYTMLITKDIQLLKDNAVLLTTIQNRLLNETVVLRGVSDPSFEAFSFEMGGSRQRAGSLAVRGASIGSSKTADIASESSHGAFKYFLVFSTEQLSVVYDRNVSSGFGQSGTHFDHTPHRFKGDTHFARSSTIEGVRSGNKDSILNMLDSLEGTSASGGWGEATISQHSSPVGIIVPDQSTADMVRSYMMKTGTNVPVTVDATMRS